MGLQNSLQNVPIAWLEWDNHKGKRVEIADRSGGVYRCKTGSFDPFSKTLELIFPDVKEISLITSGWLYRYGSVVFPGMYASEINDRFNKLLPLGSGYRLTKADMGEMMLAYYKMGKQRDNKAPINGIPVPIVREITGAHQVVVRDDGNIEASPDLRGKKIFVRVEFPMPQKTNPIAQGYLNAVLMHNDRLIRVRWCHYTPFKLNETKIILHHWEEEEKLN